MNKGPWMRNSTVAKRTRHKSEAVAMSQTTYMCMLTSVPIENGVPETQNMVRRFGEIVRQTAGHPQVVKDRRLIVTVMFKS